VYRLRMEMYGMKEALIQLKGIVRNAYIVAKGGIDKVQRHLS